MSSGTVSKSHKAQPAQAVATTTLEGFLAEFETVDALVHGCEKVRDAGYKDWDAHTPFPVHGLNEAMGLKSTLLPYVVLVMAIGGLLTAIVLQWWMNAYDYPYLVSGKPTWSIPANVPIMFELTVLFSGFTCFFGMLAFNSLPKFFHPVFSSKRFERATNDRFFISILATDPKFDAQATFELLSSLGGTAVERLEVNHASS
jgi:hypothetical protein